MANSYFKMINNKMDAAYKEKFISSIHADSKKIVKSGEQDLYTMLADINSSDAKALDINLLLKYYMLNQLIGNKENNNQPNLSDTPNSHIKKDINGKYYRLKSNCYVQDDCIQNVDDDGSYTVVEKKRNSSYRIVKTYNSDNQVTSIKIMDNGEYPVANINIAAELIGLKKEFKKKYKYSGYSGNSMDMVATIRNMLSTPVETGYYIDSRCLFYKWHALSCTFVRIFSREAESPLLVDIEFRDNGTVLRQEYTGVVA